MHKTKLTYDIVAQAVEFKHDELCSTDNIVALDVHLTSSTAG